LLPFPKGNLLLTELLQDNAGCQLPCWWGTVPGQTAWNIIQPFLATFATKITHTGFPTFAIYEADFELGENRFRVAYTVVNGTIETIKLITDKPVPGYSLAELLTNYGTPSEVWVTAASHTFSGLLHFRLLLIYPDEGFVAYYSIENAEAINDNLVGCFQQADYSTFWLPSPEEEITFEFVREEFEGIGSDLPYLPLEEATGLDVNTFYQLFSNADTNNCLETSVEFWD
jgi:hypothetical protein